MVSGTKGYEQAVQRFIEMTKAIEFEVLHRDFLPFIPEPPAKVLDIGSGIGRDAFELARRGHSVVAVEPLEAFRQASKAHFDSPNIEWIEGALPTLEHLPSNHFDFILASAIWHHLSQAEQLLSLSRIAQLLTKNGRFALSLRHGPAGLGNHIFPIDKHQIIKEAQRLQLDCLLYLPDQASLMKNKTQVTWTKLVFQNISTD